VHIYKWETAISFGDSHRQRAACRAPLNRQRFAAVSAYERANFAGLRVSYAEKSRMRAVSATGTAFAPHPADAVEWS
jgi:hypothetical protein